MGQFKRSTTINGKYKSVVIIDGDLCDYETGEQIDLVSQLFNVYGDQPFSITTTSKIDIDLD